MPLMWPTDWDVPTNTVSIAGPRAAVTEALAPLFEGLEEGLTEENIQSRLRGLLLMAQSNKFGEGRLPPATSRKSPWAMPQSMAICPAAIPIKDKGKNAKSLKPAAGPMKIIALG